MGASTDSKHTPTYRQIALQLGFLISYKARHGIAEPG